MDFRNLTMMNNDNIKLKQIAMAIGLFLVTHWFSARAGAILTFPWIRVAGEAKGWDIVSSRQEVGRRQIEAKLGRSVLHFAYSYDDAIASGRREAGQVQQLGFLTACITHQALISSASDRFFLQRLSAGTEGTVEDIRLRMAGFDVLRRVLGGGREAA